MSSPCDLSRDYSRIITLVHGTYARNSDWIKPGAHFEVELSRRLSGSARFERFLWSGRNRFSDRNEGAQDLRRHLEEVRVQFPNIPHFIIAHSHGGNVALRALQDSLVATSIAGVLCLGTPFIQVRPRRWSDAAAWALSSGALLLVTIVWLGSCMVAARFAKGNWPSLAISETAMYWILGFLTAFAIVSPLGNYYHRCTECVRSAASPVTCSRDRLLILHKTDDEAVGLLSAVRFTTWLMSRFWRPIARASDACARFLGYGNNGKFVFNRRVRTIGSILVMALAWTFLVGLVLDVSGRFYPMVPHTWLVVLGRVFLAMIGILTVPVLGMVLYCAALVPLALAIGCCMAPFFGPEMLFAVFLYDLTITSSPAGNWQTELIADLETDVSSRSLAHQVYNDSSVHDRIAQWINTFERP